MQDLNSVRFLPFDRHVKIFHFELLDCSKIPWIQCNLLKFCFLIPHEARAQPATRSSQRIATQLSQSEEDEALTIAVGLHDSEADDDMGGIEEEDSDDEDYTAGDSDHDNDKADEADDDYDYDSDDGRLEEDDDHIGESDVSSTSDASDEDLDCATEDTSDGSDNSDDDSDFSEENPTPPAHKRRDTPTSSSGPARAHAVAGAAITTAASAISPKTDISTEAPPAPQTTTASLIPSATLQDTRRNKKKRSTPRYRHSTYIRRKTNAVAPTD